MALVCRAIFGVAAADHQRHDLVAELPARHAGAERDHLAGDLEPGDVGRALGRRIEALALHHVGPVDAGGRDLDQHLALAGCGNARRSGTSISGPPGARIAIAVMSVGSIVEIPVWQRFLRCGRACDNRGGGGYFAALRRRPAMPAMDDDDRPKKKIAHEIGQELTLLSVKELEERIALLKEEIARLEADIDSKQASRNVADQFFKK